MTDLISRADAIEAVKETKPIVRSTERNWGKMIAEQHSKELVKALKALPSVDAEPKWSCTANFVAEQLERLKDMTDEEKCEFVRKFFGMGDAVQGEWVDWLGSGNEWECSICKCSIESHGSIAYNYCPMCGAKMKGESHDKGRSKTMA